MKQEKQLLRDEIKNQLEKSGTFVIAQYSALTANKANEFRRSIAQYGASFEVVRKRVFLKALEQIGIKYDLKSLGGHIGLIFAAKDPVETTKVIRKFSDDNEKVLKLIGGRVEGQLISAQDVERLATLPSKDQMRASFLYLLEAPMAQTLSTMEALLSSVMYCLENKSKKE